MSWKIIKPDTSVGEYEVLTASELPSELTEIAHATLASMDVGTTKALFTADQSYCVRLERQADESPDYLGTAVYFQEVEK